MLALEQHFNVEIIYLSHNTLWRINMEIVNFLCFNQTRGILFLTKEMEDDIAIAFVLRPITIVQS